MTTHLQTKRWIALFMLIGIAVVSAGLWSSLFLHREFNRLESTTRSLLQSSEFRTEKILSLVNNLHLYSTNFLETGRNDDFQRAEESLRELKALLAQLDAPTADLAAEIGDIEDNLRTVRAHAEWDGATRSRFRRENDDRVFEAERRAHALAQVIEQRRAAQILSMEGSLERLFVKTVIIGVAVLGILTWQLWTFYVRRVRPLSVQVVEQDLQIQAQEKLMSLALLASGVAHEIRSPLAAIKARLFTLKNVTHGNASAEEDLLAINSEVARTEKIVKSFLQLARPAEPELAIVEVGRLLSGLHQELSPLFEKDGVLLRLDTISECAIWADADQIRQCLINLLQNAKDSIESTGEVALSARVVSGKFGGKTREFVRISVSDTGKGLALDAQKRLFDPFYTTKKSGTGLGLPLTQILVTKQGGRISFQSSPGVGTVFSITLPAAPTSSQTHRLA